MPQSMPALVPYNAALEERIGAYRKAGGSLSLYDQNKSLTELRKDQGFSQYDLKRKQMLAKEWQRVRERERNTLHEMTADLVKRTNCYSGEDVRGQNLMGTQHLARSIAEQQWGTFVDLLTDKAASAGGWVRKVDPKHTSQDCSRCGNRVEKALSDRLHVCPVCGLSIDRDWNAAMNVLNRGLMVSPSSGGNAPSGPAGAENGMLGSSSI